MRIPLLLAFTATLLCAQPPAPQSTKVAKIEEIFRLTNTAKLQKQMLSQVLAMMKQQAPSGMGSDAAQKIMDFMEAKMGWEVMKDEYVKAYDETYTEDEISGILMFYQSAPGKAFLEKSPLLMQNTMAIAQKRIAEIQPEMMKMIQSLSSK